MGFEPTTSAVTGRRSNQLSHQAIKILFIPSKPIPNHFHLLSKLSFRSISTYPLSTLLHLHSKPIYLVVFKGPSSCESDISS